MIVEKNNPQITMCDISHFENTHNIKLPPAYVKFLITCNGGIVRDGEFEYVDVFDNKKESIIVMFFGINCNKSSLEQNMFFMKTSKRLPKGILPIAEDPFGNLLVISVNEFDFGSLFFWDHELELSHDGYSALAKIPKELDVFLESVLVQ